MKTTNMMVVATETVTSLAVDDLFKLDEPARLAVLDSVYGLLGFNLYPIMLPNARNQVRAMVFQDIRFRDFIMDLTVKLRFAFCTISKEDEFPQYDESRWVGLCKALQTCLSHKETDKEWCSPLIEQNALVTGKEPGYENILSNNSWLVTVILLALGYRSLERKYKSTTTTQS